jgi:hypothetical protein
MARQIGLPFNKDELGNVLSTTAIMVSTAKKKRSPTAQQLASPPK